MNSRIVMLAVVCLISGLVAGYACALAFGQASRNVPTDNSATFSAGEWQNGYSSMASPAPHSPFAVVNTVDSSAGSLSATAASTQGSPGNPATSSRPDLSDYTVMLAFLQDIHSADVKQIRTRIRASEKLSDSSPEGMFVERALFQRWSQLAARDVRQWIEQTSHSASIHAPNTRMRNALAGYSTQWPELAFDWMLELQPENPEDAVLAQVMAKSLGRSDPEGILERLDDEYETHLAYNVMSEWAQRDPQAALAWITDKATEEQRFMYQDMIMSLLMEQDPEAALAQIQTMPDAAGTPWIKAQYAVRIAQTDPDKAMQWILNQDDPILQEQALMEISWMWPADDIAGLQSHLDSVTDPELRERLYGAVAEQLVQSMASEDPYAAMAWVEGLAPSIQARVRPSAFDSWLSSDPDNAMIWLKQQPDSDETRAMLEMSIWSLPEHDLDYSLANFSRLSRHVKASAVAQLVNALDEQRPDYLETWVAGLEEPSIRQMANLALQDRTALRDVDGFIASLDSASGEERVKLVSVLYRSMNTSSSARLQTWLAENPLSISEERALQQLNEEYYAMLEGPC